MINHIENINKILMFLFVKRNDYQVVKSTDLTYSPQKDTQIYNNSFKHCN